MDALVDDILNILNQREQALKTELERIRDYRKNLQTDTSAPPQALQIEQAHDTPTRIRRRHMSVANRLAASKRMKAVWAAKRRKT